MTQVHMRHASRVQIPLLPSPMVDIVTVAQYGLERSAFNRVVGGSNPPRDKD